MDILHPYFTLIYIFLGIYAYKEVYAEEYVNFKSVWWVIIFMIFIGGFRVDGPDYRSYRLMYDDFGMYMPLDIPTIKKNIWSVEWLYVVYNIFMYKAGFSLAMFLLITIIFTLATKYYVFEKNSAYPALSMLLYITPSFFVGDMGHLRQAIAICIVFLSFSAVKKRQWWLFFPMIYIAMGFHNSSFIFVFAYFVAIIPLNRFWIILLVGISIALSPFELYNKIPFMESITPSDVYQGFEDYNQIKEEEGKIKLPDILILFYIYFIVFYDKETHKYIPYYKYMRNILVMGVCMYFFFRLSPMFSSRLVTYYLLFQLLVIPNIIASVQNIRLRRYLFGIVILSVIGYYFAYANKLGRRYYVPSMYRHSIIGG